MFLGCMGCSNEWKSKDNVALTVKKTLSVIINAHYLRACGLFLGQIQWKYSLLF